MPNVKWCEDKKCPGRDIHGLGYGDYVEPWMGTRMVRIYIREREQTKQKFSPVGWLCPSCKKLELN